MPAVSALHSGGIVAFPTETFYGLAVDPRSALAVRRIFALKQRPPDQPLPLIAGGIEQIDDHVGTMTPLARRLAARGVARPAHRDYSCVPPFVRRRAPLDGTRGRAGVRRIPWRARWHRAPVTPSRPPVPISPAIRQPQRRSALSCRSPMASTCSIDAGATPAGLPSTIVDATGDTPILVRAGAVPWERVLEFLQ